MHYLGRRKEIRGQRHERLSAEIEMLLAQHSKVRSVAIVPVVDLDRGSGPLPSSYHRGMRT
ncbi:hypothetical protein AXK59_16030 [Tsukamurella tyrosinosolvens]|nr:hypothetical protein AXK59_16030 [Tsukamurella tyrosinosolvens]